MLTHFLRLARTALIAGLWTVNAHAQDVPQFVPNVVDLTRTLSADETKLINEAIAQARELADIWGAVLIVDKLEGDTIESLAERVFREWKLGREKQDNGLLLLLSLEDRQSRFEVGYGLEGELPDVVARRALDNVLAPLMREGNIKDAVVQSFHYMAGVRSRNPVYQEMIDQNDRAQLEEDESSQRAMIGFGAFVLLYCFMPFVTRMRARHLAAALEPTMSSYKCSEDSYLYPRIVVTSLLWRIAGFFALGFVFLLISSITLWTLGICLGVLGLAAWRYYSGHVSRYVSQEAYQAYAAEQAARHAEMIKKGYMKEATFGRYEYTDAYFASAEYAAANSDSHDSSSGGGSSGGGGASSSW